MRLRRRFINWWISRADSLSKFETLLLSTAASGFVCGGICGWLGCYLFHHA